MIFVDRWGGGQGKREGEKRGRERGEEGEGGGRRGGGRREKRGGRRERGGRKGGRGKENIFAGAKRAPLQKGGGRRGGGRGEVRGGRGEAYPPVHPLIDNSVRRVLLLKIVLYSLFADAIDGLRPNSAYADPFWWISGWSICIKKTLFSFRAESL